MLLTKKVTLNLGNREIPIVIDASQGDSGRALEVHFVAGDTLWEIPDDIEIILQYQCQDGTGGVYDSLPDGTAAYSVDEDALTICLVNQVCAVVGITKLQITLFSGGAQISAFPVEVRVVPQINSNFASGSYTNLQQWLLRQLSKAQIEDAVLAALPNGDEVSY